LVSANCAWNIANFRLGLIRALASAGYDIIVAASPDGHESRLSGEPLTFVPFPIDRSGMNPVTDLRTLLRFVRLMRDCHPAAFLGFTIKPNVYGSVAAGWCAVPAINNISGLGTMFLGRGWKSALALGLYRLALRRSHTVFFQNPDDRRLFLDADTVRAGQARLLAGSGVDLNHYSSMELPDGPPVFLFIGRLLADKGVREFVEAARLTRTRYPDARFRVLGGSDPGNRTAIGTEEIERWRKEGAVELLGEAADVRPHIAAATAVVLPSYREGMPRVLLEAGAMARPLIATDVPGCRDIVSAGVNGLLCAVRDPQSLADAIVGMIERPAEERAAMGRAARRKVEREFSEQAVFEHYLAALADIRAASGVGSE
jgi:glycosyltransferase involved in cell wall biosynthesis